LIVFIHFKIELHLDNALNQQFFRDGPFYIWTNGKLVEENLDDELHPTFCSLHDQKALIWAN
jgi:hypothetical protein